MKSRIPTAVMMAALLTLVAFGAQAQSPEVNTFCADPGEVILPDPEGNAPEPYPVESTSTLPVATAESVEFDFQGDEETEITDIDSQVQMTACGVKRVTVVTLSDGMTLQLEPGATSITLTETGSLLAEYDS